MEERFTFMRIAAVVLYLLAFIAIIGGGVLAYQFATQPLFAGYGLEGEAIYGPPSLAYAAGAVLGGLLACFFLIILAQQIGLQVSIEHHTRITALLLRKQMGGRE